MGLREKFPEGAVDCQGQRMAYSSEKRAGWSGAEELAEIETLALQEKSNVSRLNVR